MATESSVSPALPASELTPERRAYRTAVQSQLNRCPHGVNLTMRSCPQCLSAFFVPATATSSSIDLLPPKKDAELLNPDIKDCPFCGSNDVEIIGKPEVSQCVVCRDCDATGPNDPHYPAARWNKRV